MVGEGVEGNIEEWKCVLWFFLCQFNLFYFSFVNGRIQEHKGNCGKDILYWDNEVVPQEDDRRAQERQDLRTGKQGPSHLYQAS